MIFLGYFSSVGLFVLSYASLFLLILSLFLDIYLFSSNRKECGFNGRKNGGTLGGVGAGKAITRMYCMKNTFSQ